MPRTYTSLLTHIIFSTKERKPIIQSELQAKLHAYLWGIAKNSRCTPMAINGIGNHVHLLIGIRPDVCVADLVRTLKANSSKWVHQEWKQPGFAWQLGYAALSVSKSNLQQVARYIAEQQRHHRRVNFQQELVAFLRKHEIEYDERYIWQ